MSPLYKRDRSSKAMFLARLESAQQLHDFPPQSHRNVGYRLFYMIQFAKRAGLRCV